MWGDDKILDLCSSSERSREAWVNQRRRTRALSSVIVLILVPIGLWLVRSVPLLGATALVAGFGSALHVQQATFDIRLLRLMSVLRVAAPTSGDEGRPANR